MKNIVGVALFVAGAGIGFGAGYFVTKTKYEKLMDEAVESVKKVYSVKKSGMVNVVNKTEPEEGPRETVEKRDARKEAERNSSENTDFAAHSRSEAEYTDYSGYTEVEQTSDETNEPIADDGIKIVTADEYQELEDYRCLNLSYYRDGILADERDDVVEMPEAIIGDLEPDELLSGGETVSYLRNDKTKTYIEIVKDDRVFYGDIIPDEEEEY